jgi:hypothetical protein
MNIKQKCIFTHEINCLYSLKLIYLSNKNVRLSKICNYYAIKNNNLEMVYFIRSQKQNFRYEIDSLLTAIKNNNLEMLKFLYNYYLDTEKYIS